MNDIIKPITILLFLVSTVLHMYSQSNNVGTDGILWSDAVPFGEGNWYLFKSNTSLSGETIFETTSEELQLSENDKMVIMSSVTDELGCRHFRYQQTYKGIPVEDGVYCVHERDGRVISANGRIIRNLNYSGVPSFSTDSLMKIATNQVPVLKDNRGSLDVELVYTRRYDTRDYNASNYCLTYKLTADDSVRYYDAETGKKVKSYTTIMTFDNCQTGSANTKYNGWQNITTAEHNNKYWLVDYCRGDSIFAMYANYTDTTRFTSEDNVWGENDWKLKGTISAFWAAEMAYDYFYNKFNRNSYDNNGSAIKIITINRLDDGAQWRPISKAIYCGIRYPEFDPSFNSFVSLDLIGHELTHAIVQYTCNLGNEGEAGSLNESFADIFGTMVEYYVEGEYGNYIQGEDITVDHTGFRNMMNPNQKNQPDTYLGTYWDTGADIHINAGVQNYWFYLLAEGGEGVNDNGVPYLVQGIGKENAARIAYWNMVYYMNSSYRYADAKIGSILAAVLLFGYNSEEVQATMAAWDAVGVNSLGSLQFNLETIPCGDYEYVHGIQEQPICAGAINQLTSKCNYVANNVPVTLYAGNEVRLVDGFYSGNNFTAAVLPLFLDDGADLPMEGTAPRMDGSVEGAALSEPLREPILTKSSSANITIYPNPAEGLVAVQSESPITQISIYDIHGKCVCNKKMRGDEVRQVETNTAVLTTGIYLVKVDYAGGGWATDRLVIK